MKAFNQEDSDTAVLWSKMTDAGLLEVRSAGKTRRLYNNGILHTEFHPDRILTGSVWDLLFIPSFFHPLHDKSRILILGVGGGAVFRLFQRYSNVRSITGIELQTEHIKIAFKYFNLSRTNLHIHNENAITWLENYKGPAFDYIIDDLFFEKDKNPARAIPGTRKWCDALAGNLTEAGTLVMNFVDHDEFRRSSLGKKNYISKNFAQGYYLNTSKACNTVAVMLRKKSTPRSLYLNMRKKDKALDTSRRGCRLDFKLHTIRI